MTVSFMLAIPLAFCYAIVLINEKLKELDNE